MIGGHQRLPSPNTFGPSGSLLEMSSKSARAFHDRQRRLGPRQLRLRQLQLTAQPGDLGPCSAGDEGECQVNG